MTAPVAVAEAGSARVRPRLYRGWAIVAALGVTTCASYGILSYAFSVFLAPMERELGWTRAELTGAFSLAWLVAGLAAVPIGRWVDRHGARPVMTAGSVAATALLVAWSRVESLPYFYAIWVGLGAAAAAVLYEPAFAVVAVWFDRRRSAALTLLTFLGGLASVLFVPLANRLVEGVGWRAALVWLAAILGAVTIPLHALVLRRRPSDLGLHPDGVGSGLPPPVARGPAAGRAGAGSWRDPSLRRLAAAFALSTFASTALTVHLVPLLLERGHAPRAAAAALGLLGTMALPGRLVFTPLGGALPRSAVAVTLLAMQALSPLALLAGRSEAALWAFVALFGAGFGAVTPARAGLVAELWGADAYGHVTGRIALALAMARAAAPVGASLLHVLAGGYGAVLLAAIAASAAAAALVAKLPQPARPPAPTRSRDASRPSGLPRW